jgi:hypothetical protein
VRLRAREFVTKCNFCVDVNVFLSSPSIKDKETNKARKKKRKEEMRRKNKRKEEKRNCVAAVLAAMSAMLKWFWRRGW